jgi:hypothetical protein
MKLKIIAPDGVVFNGKNVPEGTVLDLEKGPHTHAWLRFKQAKEVKEEAAAEGEAGKGGKKDRETK